MELLHHFQVCLQGLNLWRQVFSNFLYGLVAREVFENPGDVTSEDVDAAEFLNLPGLVGWPVNDVSQGSFLAQRDGLVHQHDLGRVVTTGQGESVEDG